MSGQTQIQTIKIEEGDYVAQGVASSDIDLPDSVIWMLVVEVVYENGVKKLRLAYPDGELRRTLMLASAVGRFKKALDFMIDEYQYDLMSQHYEKLNQLTAGHEFLCACAYCDRLSSMVGALKDYSDNIGKAKWNERKARLDKAVTALGY